MRTLFQNDSTGILISVDITQDNIQTKLYHWLKENHGSIFYNDIESVEKMFAMFTQMMTQNQEFTRHKKTVVQY